MLVVDAFLNGAEWIIDAPFRSRLLRIQGAFIKPRCSLLVVQRMGNPSFCALLARVLAAADLAGFRPSCDRRATCL